MWIFFLFLHAAIAAWPDSFEHRIAAMEALRYDLAMPGIPHNETKIRSKYQIACDKGYFDVCHPEEWVGSDGSDPLKAASFMEKKCTKSKSPLQCVVVGMAYGMVDDEISAEAPDPKRAFTAFQTACTDKAYAPGCTYLGDMYWKGVTVEPDLNQAKLYYEEACKAKDIWGCHRLGDLLKEKNSSVQEQLVQYKRSCDHGYELGCMAQAEVMMNDARTQTEWAFIADQLDRGCTYGQMDKCGYLASLYHQGKGVKRSLPLAKALYQSTCANGVAASCHALGTLFLDMKPANFKKAAETFFAACEGGYSPSCTRYGALVLNGDGVPQNIEFALRYMNKGCTSGDLEGCLVLAEAYAEGRGVQRDAVQAKALATQTCDAGFGKGCYVLAQLGEAEATWGQESTVDSSKLYEQSCSLGYGSGCAEMALRAYSNGNAGIEIQERMDIGCTGDDVRACLALGNLYQGNSDKAFPYWDAACALGDMSGCLEVGHHYSSSDLTRASEYYERVCSYGDERGCTALEPIAFQGLFEGLVKKAWLGNFCQVWAQNDDGQQLVAEATGANMKLHAGRYAGSDVTVWHLGTDISLDVVQRGESTWNVGGKRPSQENVWQTGEELDHRSVQSEESDPWGDEQVMDWNISLKHIEEWDSSKGEITRDFPGDATLAMGDKGILQYSRSMEQLYGQCGYTGGHSILRTEHCSDVQSLILGYLMMDCSVEGAVQPL